MKIDEKLILNLERLSRLSLSENERAEIMGDLNKIVDMFDQLQALDTNDVEPLVYMNDQEPIFRTDKVNQPISKAQALKNAPKTDGDFFLVPKMIKK